MLSFSSTAFVSGETDIDHGKINQFIDNDMYTELLDYSNELLDSHPNNEEALTAKGMALYYLDKEEESIEYFNKALEINPKNEDALDFKASALYYLEQYELSKIYFDKSVLLAPGNTYALDYLYELSYILPTSDNYIDSSQFDHLVSYIDFSYRPTLITFPEKFTPNWYVDVTNGFAMKFQEDMGRDGDWRVQSSSTENRESELEFTNIRNDELYLQVEFIEGGIREHSYENNKTFLLLSLDKSISLGLESNQEYDYERISSSLEEYSDGFVYNLVMAASAKNDSSVDQIYLRAIYLDDGRSLILGMPLSFFTTYGTSSTLEMIDSIYLGDVQKIDKTHQQDDSSLTYDGDLFTFTSSVDWNRQLYHPDYSLSGYTIPVSFIGWNADYTGNSPPSITAMFKDGSASEYNFDIYSDIELLDKEMEESFFDAIKSGIYDLKFVYEELQRFDDHIKITFETNYLVEGYEMKGKYAIWKFADGKIFSLQYNADQADFAAFIDDFENTAASFEIKSSPSSLSSSKNQVVIQQESVQATVLPDWIRNNAEWWAKEQIDDDAFTSGIQFLVKEGIINVPATTIAPDSQQSKSEEIPEWIKNNADWWAQGLISDEDFLKGIQYLIQQGIVKV